LQLQKKNSKINHPKIMQLQCTGVARNFDWEGPKTEESCDINLVTFFDDAITMTSLKWRHNWLF